MGLDDLVIQIAYFVHDLSDAAVCRRVRMMQIGGTEEIALLGFRRSERSVAEMAGLVPTDLGRTYDRHLLHRALAVAGALVTLRRWRDRVEGATVFLARNLEMLLLAAAMRRRFAPGARLVYECLDIHRLMLSPGPAGAGLRAVERVLLRECSLLVVSAPDYIGRYFRPVHALLPPVYLLENKVLSEELPAGRDKPPPAPPWRIGWFGNLRCRRSLHLLAGLAARSAGSVEVVLRGRPQYEVMPDFDAVVARTPGMAFLGPYDRHADLPAIYADVHFAWAIDLYDARQNSDWLLMNRLYEGGLHGAVPIALRSVATGRWLANRGIGLLLDVPVEASLAGALAGMDTDRYLAATAAVAARPVSDFIHDERDSAALVATFCGRAEV